MFNTNEFNEKMIEMFIINYEKGIYICKYENPINKRNYGYMPYPDFYEESSHPHILKNSKEWFIKNGYTYKGIQESRKSKLKRIKTLIKNDKY